MLAESTFLVGRSDIAALKDAIGALADAAATWNGEYTAALWGPCGRVDAVVEGVEVVARVVAPAGWGDHRTYLRAYPAHPLAERVTLRRPGVRDYLVTFFMTCLGWERPRLLDPLLDGAFAAYETRPGALHAFLSERLRAGLRALVRRATVGELSYRDGTVALLVHGLAPDVPTLDSALEVVVAAARWESPRGAYR